VVKLRSKIDNLKLKEMFIMNDATRMFRKDDLHNDNKFEVLTVKASDVIKQAQFGNIAWAVKPSAITDLQSYVDVGEISKDEEFCNEHIILTETDAPKWFREILGERSSSDTFETAIKDYNEYNEPEKLLTIEDLQSQFEKIAQMDVANEWVNYEETYTYWDGSNHKSITLTGEYTEWVEITNDEEYQIVNTLDRKNNGYGEYKIVECKDGSKYKVYISHFQKDISEDWEITTEESL
jgi:hypothetical protein